MARGKYLSLEEARTLGNLDQFAKEHPSKGNEKEWNNLFEAMAKGVPTMGLIWWPHQEHWYTGRFFTLENWPCLPQFGHSRGLPCRIFIR